MAYALPSFSASSLAMLLLAGSCCARPAPGLPRGFGPSRPSYLLLSRGPRLPRRIPRPGFAALTDRRRTGGVPVLWWTTLGAITPAVLQALLLRHDLPRLGDGLIGVVLLGAFGLVAGLRPRKTVQGFAQRPVR